MTVNKKVCTNFIDLFKLNLPLPFITYNISEHLCCPADMWLSRGSRSELVRMVAWLWYYVCVLTKPRSGKSVVSFALFGKKKSQFLVMIKENKGCTVPFLFHTQTMTHANVTSGGVTVEYRDKRSSFVSLLNSWSDSPPQRHILLIKISILFTVSSHHVRIKYTNTNTTTTTTTKIIILTIIVIVRHDKWFKQIYQIILFKINKKFSQII